MSETQSGLIDIVEPLAPQLVENNEWFIPIVLMLSVVTLLLLSLWLWKYKLPAYRAIKGIRILRKKLVAGEHTPQEALLMLALDLRHGLGLKRLRADILPARCNKQDMVRWTEFMQQLDTLMYEKNAELNIEKLDALIVQIEYWLRRYSQTSKLKKLES